MLSHNRAPLPGRQNMMLRLQWAGVAAVWLSTVAEAGLLPASLPASDTTSLAYSDQDYSSTIPTELGLLTKLTNWELHTNQLTGSVPSQLGSLTGLVNFNMGTSILVQTNFARMYQPKYRPSPAVSVMVGRSPLPPRSGRRAATWTTWSDSQCSTTPAPRVSATATRVLEEQSQPSLAP